MLKIGDKAPDFALKDKDSKSYALSKLKSKYFVLYFYPKDNTPGCTIEANEFSKDVKKYCDAEVTVIGISGGDDASKKKFCEKNNLKIILLSDPNFSVSKKYGVYGKYGKKGNWGFLGGEDAAVHGYNIEIDVTCPLNGHNQTIEEVKNNLDNFLKGTA